MGTHLTRVCRRRRPASARTSLPLPAAPETWRWAPRVREETSPRHLPQPGGAPPPGRASRQDGAHHPTRDSALLGRAGSQQRGRRSPTARAGTVRGVSRGLARGTAGTGPPQAEAGLYELAAEARRPGWRPSAACAGGVPHVHSAIQRRGRRLGVAAQPLASEARGRSRRALGPEGSPRVGRGGRGAESRGPRGGVPCPPAPGRGVRVWRGGVGWGVKAKPGARSRAQQGRAGDGFQLPLRFSFQPRLTPSVRQTQKKQREKS